MKAKKKKMIIKEGPTETLPKKMWIDERGLRHTIFIVEKEIPKCILDRLEFKPYKVLGCDPLFKSIKVYPILYPGDVLKLKSGKYVLVGHVNRNLGGCDDWEFTEADIKEVASLYKMIDDPLLTLARRIQDEVKASKRVKK